MRILALDPGKTTGFAILEDGIPTDMGEVKIENFNQFLDARKNIDVVVCENFRIRPGINIWGEVPEIRLIGRVEYWCHLNRISLFLQEPAIKPVAYGLAQLGDSKKKKRHALDAVAHGTYWYHKVVKKANV